MSAQGRAEGLLPTFTKQFPEMFSFDRFFESPMSWKSRIPPMNVKEQDDHYEVEFATPGLKKEDFNIVVRNGILIISSETKEESTEENEGYTRREFSHSSFKRSLTLPPDADESKIQAKYQNGLLIVNLFKKAGIAPKEAREIQID